MISDSLCGGWCGNVSSTDTRLVDQGHLPRGIGITELRDVPSEWSKQYLKLGLPLL